MGSDRFKFNDGSMNSIMNEMSREKRKLSDIETQIKYIKRNLSSSIKDKQGVNVALDKIASSVDKSQVNVNRLSNGLIDVRRQYNLTEDKIAGVSWSDRFWRNTVGAVSSILYQLYSGGYSGKVDLGKLGVWDYKVEGKGSAKGKILDKDKGNSKHNRGFESSYERDENGKLKKTEASRWKDGKEEVWDPKKKKYVEKNKTDKDGKKLEYDPETGKYVPKKTTADKLKAEGTKALSDAKIAEASLSKEGSVWSDHIGDKETGNYAEAKFLTAEAHATGTLSTGCIRGEIGASATIFEASAQGRLGSEYNNVHASGTVKAGSVSGKAEVKAGWLDEKGHFNPSIKAGASAEAVAVSAEGKAGVTIAGTEVNAVGSVGVGVGAHADIGFSDGKLKVDVGAYLGVGGSVSLEIDVSKTVKGVADFAKKNTDKVVKAGKAVVSGIKKLFHW